MNKTHTQYFKKISCLVITTLLVGCGKSQTIAEKHLEALKSGDTGLAQSQYCAVTDNLRINNVLDYSILGTSEKEREGFPYQEVKVYVTEGLLKEKIEKTYNLEIWNPDNHFRFSSWWSS